MGKILVVDDEREMCDLLAKDFESEGHEVDTAYDAEEAILKSTMNQYNFLLVDLVLPGRMNGMDVITKVRSMSPNIHIVAYSGFSDLDITEKVIQAGANYFITKPFKHDELLEKMFSKNNQFIN